MTDSTHRTEEKVPVNLLSKELECLFALGAVMDDWDIDWPDTVRDILRILPKGFREPELLGGRLTVAKEVFHSPGFKETEWILRAPFTVPKSTGMLEVAYKKAPPLVGKHRGFLLEEKKLLNVTAQKIGRCYTRKVLKLVPGRVGVEPGTLVADRRRPEWQLILDLLKDTDVNLWKRILRKLMNHLSHMGVPGVNDLIARFDPGTYAGREKETRGANQPLAKRDVAAIEAIFDDLLRVASVVLPHAEITALIKQWIRQDKLGFLALATEQRDVTLHEIIDVVEQLARAAKGGDPALAPSDAMNVRVALTRRFLTDRLPFISVAKNYLNIPFYSRLLRRVIGPSRGNGKLGGKASGLLLAEQILLEKGKEDPLLKDIDVPHAWFLMSDGLFEFVHYNSLEDTQSFKYSAPDEVRQNFPYLEQVFKHSFFPPDIVNALKMALDDLGEGPLIVRSSSLLEDSEGTAFSGKYRSLFLVNTGSREERLEALMDAVAEVYASILGPDPIQYRRERGLLDFMEEMGILIQRVVGCRVGKYYLPAFAGVAFSNNEFRWSPRLRREDGIIRLVTGLGTRAVDRVGDDYPIMVSPGQPGLRVNVSTEEKVRYSQRYVDVLNMENGRFESPSFEDLVRQAGDDYPMLEKIVSILDGDTLRKPASALLDTREGDFVITFAGLFENTPFLKQMRAILTTLEEAIGTPVDVEFAHDGKRLYMLQCRPQTRGAETVHVAIPAMVPDERKIFSSHQYVSDGQVPGITHIVYIPPEAYTRLPSEADMVAVGEAVGRLNGLLPRRRFILVGPGRWGSRGDITLGVRVGYSDISNCSMLVEVARQKGGYTPEVSFGTHFFQDLVESRIRYLPLYPDRENTIFNEAFLMGSPSSLADLLPDFAYLEDVIRVISIEAAAPGCEMMVIMDGEKDEALGFLTDAPDRTSEEEIHEPPRRRNGGCE